MTKKKKKQKEEQSPHDIDIEIVEEKENLEKYKQKKKEAEDIKNSAEELNDDELIQLTGEELKELQRHVEKATGFKESLQQIQEEAGEYRDQLLRLQAEFDNYRKRIIKEKEAAEKYALENFFKTLIPVYDNFLHALNAIENAQNLESIKEGVQFIFGSFTDLLVKHGFEKIEAVGKKFDPNYHEAVLYEEVEGAEPMEVVEELQAGYIYRNRVIKPTLVKVAK